MSLKSNQLHDQEVQTVVKVFPFILSPEQFRASVTSDKKFCTVLSLEATSESSKFYSLLQFCPYQDIEENSIRVIDLPRKTKLQWERPTHISDENLINCSLADDDGVADMCTDLLMMIRSGKKTMFANTDTQTELMIPKDHRCPGKSATHHKHHKE
ncbi:hypothetical protein ABEB36_005356 [Hypothenemus hampei]|uniref:Uncharacterized protein n=1 Tax=Hypothenemus hampei TaxID=57062 RepID=A0ABD1EYC5_HYPHA